MKRVWSVGALLINATLSVASAAFGLPAKQAAQNPVQLTAFPLGIFSVQAGPLSRRLDLSGDLPGCTSGTFNILDPKSLPTGGAYDSDPTFVTGGAADTRVIDLVRRDPFWYLTFQARLPSNCSVQGRCGGGTLLSLVWLKLSAQLEVAAKQVETLSDCYTDTALNSISPGGQAAGKADEELDPSGVELKLTGVGKEAGLALIYTRPNLEAKTQTVSQLRYHHAQPQSGLKISRKTVPLN